jgi:hypothetical protein
VYSQLALTYSMIDCDAAKPATRVPDTLSRKFGGHSKMLVDIAILLWPPNFATCVASLADI